MTALFLATVTSTAFAYLLSRRWSFAGRGGHRRLREAALFFVVNAGAVAVNLVPALVSRYALHLSVPHVSHLAQEVADFVAGMVLGTLSGTAVRWYGYRRWVFPKAAPSAPPGGVPQNGEPVAERLAGPRAGTVLEMP